MLKIAVILSSVRPGRLNDRVAKMIIKEINGLGHEAIVIDPLQPKYSLPLVQTPLQYYKNQSQAPSQLHDISNDLKSADAFVVVSAEYNHSIPPALTNLMDHFGPEYKRKPSGICCYSVGPFGGVRAGVALRPYLAVLGCSSIPTMFAIPTAGGSINEDGTVNEPRVTSGAQSFISELVWYGEALKNHREN
ncbi:flavoprotein-like protein [Globomyces pollinis-pini]|nr:flavoprotein-like protein [Globomyces pollinis-pini]